MKRIPPLLTISLAVIWLSLNGSLAAGHIALGAAFALVLMFAGSKLRPVHPRLRNLHVVIPLVLTVLYDIARSNIGVARIVLGLVRAREVRSGFLEVPLELRDPHGLAILAAILTSTPGTAWGGVSADGGTLTLHILDLKDEAEWISIVKDRYERRLLRIFQ
jgi:multicomponent K+:H+ antiporter subunit E